MANEVITKVESRPVKPTPHHESRSPRGTTAKTNRRHRSGETGPEMRWNTPSPSGGNETNGGVLDGATVLSALLALRRGDFRVRLPVGWTGVSGKVADTFNEVAEMMSQSTDELSRISRVVGKEGRIQERMGVRQLSGAWSEQVNSVNTLIDCLAHPVSETARVIGAVAKGDLSQKMALEIDEHSLEGAFLRTAKTVNTMVDQLGGFASEVNRVAREVGTEGKLGGQARVKGVAGTWKDLTDNVNLMASNLTSQVRNIATVTTAVATGNLTKKITVDVRGEFLELKDTINTMVDQLRSFASEVTRVAREVGTEGKLGGQARVEGVSGTWKDLTDNVNFMAGNLTSQVRNIAAVTTAVANGDLSKKITVNVKGEILQLKNTINTMVDQLSSFASEVTRVAREVGTEGKLGGQARVEGVAGTWKDLTDNVNFMAGNLTAQVRNIAEVTTAVATGNLSKKITVNVRGEILELKNTINTMVDQLSSFAAEVTRVAREVGTEGKLGGQAEVQGVAGTWKDLTDSVNSMAGNLTAQVRNIAEVTTAVATGNLSRKITVNVRGEILELKNTINTMVDQLSSFAAEVTRVAREVGTEGKLGGQAEVQGVAGTWKDLTDSVNSMAGNLTAQVRNIAEVTTAVANGDLSRKITVDVKGEILQLKDTMNTMVDQLRSFASEVTRVAREVGTEGRLGGQAEVRGVAGTWKDLTESVNSMAGNLTAQVRNIAEVTTAVANGDLSKKITVEVKGEILQLKDTINTMVDQLRSFADEVTRVAREVGTEGKLGGQAQVRGASGTWKDLTDNVNFMASNLTNQVRGIAKVVTAVARGDLKRKLLVEAKGEIAELADTINSMIETLATFAEQVTSVAREVGVEGKLGGQASVPGASGTWKDLTENVNQLAANLTTQVRAIANVATAVTKGDLTRFIQVDASGEVAALKDNINEMIRNLKDTTIKNNEQDWLKTNLAKFSRMLQGQKDMLTVGKLILSELAPVVSAQQGVFYVVESRRDESTEEQESERNEPYLKLLASYAFRNRKNVANRFALGEGLVGQAALECERILVTNAPGDYVQISSGLGQAKPTNIIVLPVLFEGRVKAVMELSSFEQFSTIHQAFLDQLVESIGIVLNTIEANTRTEDLLKQSQTLARELQTRQEQLQQTNLELQEKAKLLAEQKTEVERKNTEVQHASQALEEKAEQLALTSKYKSEFLANMSHELRTPLNSLLILADQLVHNAEGNLTAKQIEYARTIHASGNDLLSLINDILDLSKIESGTVSVDIAPMQFGDLRDYVERTFHHVAEAKGLGFSVEMDAGLPPSMQTDSQRLEQVLRNLLSNAFKFTERGRVTLSIAPVSAGWSPGSPSLDYARSVVAFSVTDSGIGIAPEKQRIIFEAFQQADGSTSRKYGGTGLGLAISREIAHLLGGEIRLVSVPGQGSTFTLYLPSNQVVGRTPAREGSYANLTVPVTSAAPSNAEETESVPSGPLDDRGTIHPSDRVVVIAEDEPEYSQLLINAARETGFKAVCVPTAAAAAVMARESKPTAVLLDSELPDLESSRALERLKVELTTRHIPVQVMAAEQDPSISPHRGAFSQVTKSRDPEFLRTMFTALRQFVEHPARRVLVVASDAVLSNAIRDLISDDEVTATVVDSSGEAMESLRGADYDCLIVGVSAMDEATAGLVERIRSLDRHKDLPVIMYAADELADEEVTKLEALASLLRAESARSPERVLDLTTLILHRNFAKLPERQRTQLKDFHHRALEGRTVLLVDDDIRNIFAMTSVLERFRMRVVSAENGKDAIDILMTYPDIDVVLMDIMLPTMDGYATIRAIRETPRLKDLPIIAVTAKAMKGDREKCLAAGASDYLCKPVEVEQLRATLRVWLPQ